MRMPTYEDLSKEQDAICMLAPLDGATLVSGPPGTGKTVVAFYRAETAARQGQSPKVLMYSTVLHRYSSNASKNKTVRSGVTTWFSWLGSWWKTVFGSWAPQVAQYSPDWDRMLPMVFGLSGSPPARKKAYTQWGHLIVDEGQDFPKEFYQLAAIVLEHASTDKAGVGALTVLADENQRLNPDRNASLEQIRAALGLSPGRHYRLTRNYRNTFEIARAAAHFYCDLPGGIPELPQGRHGNRPRILRTDDLDASVDAIRRFVRNQNDLEVGVFLPTQALQAKYANKLEYRLQDLKGLRIQRYASGDKKHGDAKNLVFDRPGTITVLCDQSCKGLEFDAVFVPELQARRWDPASIDHMRMQFYVLCARARQHLVFLYSSSRGETPPILQHFPSPATGLMEWGDA